MRIPDWYVTTPAPKPNADATWTVAVRVRTWHPGYWRFVARAAWAQAHWPLWLRLVAGPYLVVRVWLGRPVPEEPEAA